MRIPFCALILALSAGCAAPEKDKVLDKPSIVAPPKNYCEKNPNTPICKKSVAKQP